MLLCYNEEDMLNFYLLSLILGLVSGSFLNAVIWRHRLGLSLLGRSLCPRCRQKLNWFELVPIGSFLVQQGRCRHCQEKIDWQYPLVELALAGLFLAAAAIFKLPFNFWGLTNLILVWYLLWVLLGIFVYDLKYGEIPDKFTIPAMIIFLILPWKTEAVWRQHLVSGIVGGGFFALQFFISKGRWIGGGDIRLGALMGLVLGLPKLLLALLLAYISGAIFGVGLILFGKKTLDSRLPFGTFLSAATVVALFFGKEIIKWYLST